jgi:uncharacterized repeat protein (TIGR01451 family)
VTGTNASGSATGTSSAAGPVNEAPANSVAPSIAGTSTEGQILTAAPGTWTGYPTPALTYQWLRCDTSGNNCANIASATSSTYTLVGADVGSTVRVAVTGTNVAGTASATATQTATVVSGPAAPSSTGLPTISGTTTVGQLLTATAGTWTGNPAPTLSYQWERCDLAGSSCASVAGATGATYTLVTADAGSTMRVVETGTNASGSASASSAQTSAVNLAPANTALPIIGGTTTEGQTLSVGTGSWTGYPAPTYGYQWRRCDTAGSTCADIASATSSSYVLVSGDVGATIRAVVTGTNVAGSAAATTAPSATIAVAPASPANGTLPTVSGTTTVGQVLTATGGTWTGTPSPTLGYQWERCDAAGANCASVAGATATTYTLVVADTGATMRVAVTGTNVNGSSTASSTPTSVVNMAPANTVPPTIGGSAVAGQLLSAATGTWTGSPSPTHGYQWRRCDAAGSNCANVAGATTSSYTLVSGDIGSTLRVEVTGTNVAGSATATSAQTATVAAASTTPANTAPPTITGTTTVGQILTLVPGTWTGTPSPTVGEQWQRCDAAGSNCADIPGATGNTYTLTTGDAGSTFRVVERGTNGSGTTTATSVQTAVVTAPSTPPTPPAPTPPAPVTPPTIAGTPKVGTPLTADPGTWADPAPVSYQWQRCDAQGNNCTDIPGATGQSYMPVGADEGGTIQVVVTNTTTGAGKTTRTGPVAGTTPTAGGSKVYTPPVVATGTSGAQSGSAPADSVPADGTRYAVVRVELFDAAGNPVSGRTSADFTVTIDGVAVATAVRETPTPGVYELEVRSSTVNEVTLAVSVNGVPLSQHAVVRFVQATANLDIQLSASNETPEMGQQVVFTVVVKNPGPNAATGVEVEQKLSDRVRYVSSDASRGQYDATRGIWSIGGIALGESVSLKITVTVIK